MAPSSSDLILDGTWLDLDVVFLVFLRLVMAAANVSGLLLQLLSQEVEEDDYLLPLMGLIMQRTSTTRTAALAAALENCADVGTEREQVTEKKRVNKKRRLNPLISLNNNVNNCNIDNINNTSYVSGLGISVDDGIQDIATEDEDDDDDVGVAEANEINVSNDRNELVLPKLEDVQYQSLPDNIMGHYTDDGFRLQFKMRKSTVEILCQQLAPFLQPQPHRFSYHPIENKILMTLSILANNESFNVVAERFCISKGTAHILFVSVCQAIRQNLMSQYVVWPSTLDACDVIAKKFESNHTIPGIVGVLGSMRIRIRSSQNAEHDYVTGAASRSTTDGSGYGEKGNDCICLQIVTDHRMKFLDVSTTECAQATDADVLLASPLGKRLTQSSGDCFPTDDYHLVANVDCPLLPQLMVPFANEQLNETQMRFNEALSSVLATSHIAFEQVTNRFKRLLSMDTTTRSIAMIVVETACILHSAVIELEADFGVDDSGLLEQDVNLLISEADLVEKERQAQAKRNQLLQLFQ